MRPAKDTKYPDKLHHSNPRLSERWYCHFKGRNLEKKVVVTEQLDKSGTDALSGISASCLQDETQRPKGPDRHKTLHTKINSTMGRVNKLISKVEQTLPSLRKQNSDKHKQMKEGLAAIRYIKDNCMDQLEDLKEVSPDYMTQEKNLEQLQTMLTQLQEAHDVLQEALVKHGKQQQQQQQPITKQEEGHASAGQEGDYSAKATAEEPSKTQTPRKARGRWRDIGRELHTPR